MLTPDDRTGSAEVAGLIILGLLATVVRLAADPPRSLARMIWLTVAGLGMASGGWVVAKGAGLDGWQALAAAWVAGAVGSEATLPILLRWLQNRLGLPPSPPAQPRQ